LPSEMELSSSSRTTSHLKSTCLAESLPKPMKSSPTLKTIFQQKKSKGSQEENLKEVEIENQEGLMKREIENHEMTEMIKSLTDNQGREENQGNQESQESTENQEIIENQERTENTGNQENTESTENQGKTGIIENQGKTGIIENQGKTGIIEKTEEIENSEVRREKSTGRRNNFTKRKEKTETRTETDLKRKEPSGQRLVLLNPEMMS